MVEPDAPMRCDVAIVGGGMTGLSLAVALRALPLDVVVIEPVPLAGGRQPSFDQRTSALANGTRRILESLGVWQRISPAPTPIRRIHISDRGAFAFARIDAAEEGVAALGYTVTNADLGTALAAGLEGATRVRLLCPAAVTRVGSATDGLLLGLDGAAVAGGPRRLQARLTVVADGAQSALRTLLGIGATTWGYDQHAVIANVAPQRFHDHVAYERFTPTGPIALLPAHEALCTVVWSLAPESARRVCELADAEFLAELGDAFGTRLGRFLQVGRRFVYPLALTRSACQTTTRAVVIGNAAQTLHPIAGQGFNLGLRDVATLAEVIADDCRARGAGADPGDAAVLAAYTSWRHNDRRTVIGFTDGLVRLFGNPLPPVRAARAVGLLAFDLFPPAKAALARLSMGLAGRVPRLARGLPL
jgi:2-octaprenyl-6-methoxyphenol hydroxylase